MCIHKHIAILAALAFVPAAVSAQYYYVKRQNEAGVYVFGGLSALQYSLSSGSVSARFGGGAGGSYAYFFNDYLALVTGFEAGTFSSSLSGDTILSGKHERHTDNIRPQEMILNGKYENYQETQTAVYGHIPVMAQLLIPAMKAHNFYVAAGVKLGVAFYGLYQTSFSRVTVSAYLPLADLNIVEVPQLGFITRSNVANMYDVNGSVPFGINLAGAAEAGIRWALEDGAALYTGIYLDYGILDIQKTRGISLITSGKTANIFEYHSILESRYQQQAAYPSTTAASPVVTQNYVAGVRLAAVGIKVKLAFNASAIPIVTRSVQCGCPRELYR